MSVQSEMQIEHQAVRCRLLCPHLNERKFGIFTELGHGLTPQLGMAGHESEKSRRLQYDYACFAIRPPSNIRCHVMLTITF